MTKNFEHHKTMSGYHSKSDNKTLTTKAQQPFPDLGQTNATPSPCYSNVLGDWGGSLFLLPNFKGIGCWRGMSLSLLLLLVAGTTSIVAQTTVTLTSSRATIIYEGDKTKNYGSCDVIGFEPDAGYRDYSLLGFDLSSIPAGATITGATLRLVHQTSSTSGWTEGGDPFTVNVRRLTRAWVEGTVCNGTQSGSATWNSASATNWTTAGGDFDALNYGSFTGGAADPNGTVYTVNVLTLVNQWFNGTYANHGIMLQPGADPNSGDEYWYVASDEHPIIANRPRLIVTYTIGPTLSTVITNATCPSGNNGAVDLTVTGGTPGYNYAWTGPNSFTATSQDISGRIPGTYSVTVTDANGFQAQASYTVSGPSDLTDTDGDVIINDCDSDDDNDGILDTNECGTTAGNQQLNYSFYDGSFTATSQIPTIGALATGLVSNFNINTLQNTADPGDSDSYGIRYTGFINIATAGTYTFYTTSDDGSRLFINNTQVVDNDFLQPPTERSGTITLAAGWHSLEVLFFESGGGESFSVSYEGPSIAKQALPFNILSSVLPQTCTDTDGDGIVDRLDNDSDNDACADAIEGGANFTAANINGNGRLTGGVGANGVPTIAGAGQTAGNSKIATQLVVNTPPANSSVVAPAGTSFTIATTASSNTSWTGPTNARVPVYGTPGNANAQRAFQWYLGNPNAGGAALTNTGVYSGVNTATLNISNSAGLSGNVYYVVVTLADNECIREIRSATLINACATLALTPTVIQPTCFASGSISLNATGGTSPYTYDWADLPGTSNPQNRVGLAAGTYNLTVTDANGCTVASGNLTLTAATGCTGVIVCRSETARVFSVVPDPNVVAYNWTVPAGAVITAGQGTPSITVNFTSTAPGASTVCCSTQNDCGTSTQTCQNIDVNQASATATASPVCTGGNLSLFASGGGIYSWSGPSGFTSSSQNPVRYGVAAAHAGTYTVTITTTSGCTATASVVAAIGTSPSLVIANTNPACGSSNGAVNLTVSGGVSPYTYLWSNGATTEDLSNLDGGNYTVTVTGSNGCSATAVQSVSDNSPAPTVSATPTAVTCASGNNGSVSINVSGGTSPYTYLWSNGATTQNISALPAGNYGVIVTSANGCQGVTNATVTQPNALQLDATQVNIACNGSATGSINLLVSGGTTPYSYSWSGPTVIGNTASPTNLLAGTYNVTVTATGGCTATRSVVLTQPTALTASASPTAVSCNGGANGIINLTVSGGTAPYTYAWARSGGGFSATTQDITSLTAGTYTVTVADTRSCTTTASAVVSQPAAITFTNTKVDVACNGTATGSINLTPAGGTPSYTFIWSNGATTEDIASLAAGTYTVTATDVRGCTGSTSITVAQATALAISVSKTDVACNGASTGSITLTVSGGTSPYNYNWGGGITSQNRTNLASGNYTVTVTGVGGCTATALVTITQNIAINISGTVQNATCNGSSTGTITLNVNGGAGSYTYAWSGAGTGANPRTGLAAGSYTVTVTDASLCTRTANFTVTQPTALSASGTATLVSCYGASNGSVNLNVSGGTLPYTLTWSNGADTEDLSGLAVGNYSVTVADNNHCTVTQNFTITQPNLLTVSGTATPNCPTSSNGSVALTVSGGNAPYTYTWSGAGTGSNPRTGLAAGTYSVTVTDSGGCTATASNFELIPLSVIASGLDRNCTAQNGQVYASVNGGLMPYAFLWNNGATTESISGLNIGTYTVTVTSGACAATAQYTVSQPASCLPPVAQDDHYTTPMNTPLLGTVMPSDPLNAGYDYDPIYPLDSLAFENLEVINEAMGLIEWDEEGSFTFIPATNFTGTVTIDYEVCNPLGLCDQATLFIVVPITPILANDDSAGPIYGGTGAPAVLNVFDNDLLNGSPVTTWTVTLDEIIPDPANVLTLNPHGTIDVAPNSASGIYHLTYEICEATNLTNCDTALVTVTVFDSENCGNGVDDDNDGLVDCADPNCANSFTVNLNVTASIICIGENTNISASASGGIGPYTYVWSHGLGSGVSHNITPLTTTSYTVTVTSATGCTSISQLTITVNYCDEICTDGIDNDGDGLVDCADPDCGLALVATPINPTCGSADGQVILLASGGSGIYQYSNNNSNWQVSNIFSGLAAGNFTFYVRNASGTCPASATTTLTTGCENCTNGIDDDGDGLADCTDSDCQPLSSAGTNITICMGTSTNLTATATGGTGPYSFAWSNGLGFGATKTVNPTSTTGYSVTVSSATGCSSTALVTVTVTPCTENCTDGADNDNDGLTDCADPDCMAVGMPQLVNDVFYTCPGTGDYGNLVSLNDGNLQNPTFTILAPPSKGSVSINNFGAFNYSPADNQCGSVSFTYQVCNAVGCCATANTTIHFGDNLPPTLQNVPADLTISCDDEVPQPPVVVATDLCPVISISVEDTDDMGSMGTCGNYTITRTWTATDLCGNVISQSQKIAVSDQTRPEMFRVYTLPNGKKMVAGNAPRTSHLWKYVKFPVHFDTPPLVFAQVTSNNDAAPVVAQTRYVSTTGFEVRLREEEAADQLHNGETVGWMAIEAGNMDGSYKMAAQLLNNANHNYQSIAYPMVFPTNPVFVASVNGTVQTDPVSVRIKSGTTSSIEVSLQEEQSADSETNHVNENLAWLAVQNGNIYDSKGGFVAECGIVAVDHNWLTVNLLHRYSKPVVLFGGMTVNGGQAATIRVRNVTPTSFQVRVQGWAYLAGSSAFETLGYLVVEGSIPTDDKFYCFNETPLQPGVDVIAIDNCDGQVAFGYDELEDRLPQGLQTIRVWTAIDDCGNVNLLSRYDTCRVAAVKLRTLLSGALLQSGTSGLMRDNLRSLQVLPKVEPYSDLTGFQHRGKGGKEEADSNLFDADSNSALVDWIFVECRNPLGAKEVLSTIAVLLRKDGSVATSTGDSVLYFWDLPHGDYLVAVRHRNHLGLLTENNWYLSTDNPPMVDFTSPSMPVKGGTTSGKIVNGRRTMWAGDFNGDRKTIYQGPYNDIFFLFSKVLSEPGNVDFLANYIVEGYTRTDFNLDGQSIYQGPNNDRSMLLLNTILTHPLNNSLLSNFIAVEVLP